MAHSTRFLVTATVEAGNGSTFQVPGLKVTRKAAEDAVANGSWISYEVIG